MFLTKKQGITLRPNPDKPVKAKRKSRFIGELKKSSHAKTQRRKENLQSIRNSKNAILYQRSPKIDEKSQPSVNVIGRINNDLRNFVLSHTFFSLRLCGFA